MALYGIQMKINANFYLRTAVIRTKRENVLYASMDQRLLKMGIANVNNLTKELEMDGASI
jgi:hypothetical protein